MYTLELPKHHVGPVKSALWIWVVTLVFAGYVYSSDGHNEHSTEASASHEHAESVEPTHAQEGDHFKNSLAVKFLKVVGIEDFLNHIHTKLDTLRKFDEHYEFLKKRVAMLEIENAELKHRMQSYDEFERVREMKKKSLEEGGRVTSRTLASVSSPQKNTTETRDLKSIYRDAQNSFYQEHYDEAAKDFLKLEAAKENEYYQGSKIAYYTAVSFYHLDNYKMAQKYFQRAILIEESKEHTKVIAPKSLAWLALCSKQLGQKQKEKEYLFELQQKYPGSEEARKVNH